MTDPKPTRTVRRGRIFPDIQWSEEKKAQWKAQQEAFSQHGKVIFDRVQPELIKTHHNWYLAVEPESGDYFTDTDELTAINKSRQQHPNASVFIFRINETGIAGTI
ncbi:hypothetical protein PQG02_08455 [Nostoc sp. UHCC 0926]|uniref:hypothetical protein n=1 Tax=unclassified Nostoc TaxID=2593658 RepID=UPI00236144B7|nr:hypothetical protein [Nostoc sp. UHCC 0926]WDD34345.1 hypothetical protein PQG02_08455 [Nostoc sp. UHCC 0926]